MSFFLATVPAGTQLYHGTSKPEPIQGLEWLAFEPEHAMIFARPHGPPPGDDKDRPPREDKVAESQSSHHGPGHPPSRPKGPEQDANGYLHTYAPKHDIRLLYIDGLSAGKTSNGTLDTQDMLLLNSSTLDPHGPMGGEHERAYGMCNMTSTLWEGKIDGILRMEGGFEIILCDFAKHLERTDAITVTQHQYWTGEKGFLGGWSYIKAVTRRYHGIGGDRVQLDLNNFVSVFSYSDLGGLFTNDVHSDYAMPRLQNVKEADRIHVKDDVTEMILRKDWDKETAAKDWQAVADNVVARYAKPLHYLHTNKEVRGDKKALEFYLINLLHPFIDYTARNATVETQRCVAQVIPPLPTPPSTAASLAHRTVHAVTHHICDTLLTALSIASASTSHASFTQVYAELATDLIDKLVDYLNWTTWKECGTCADEEICYIPIWPMGNNEDHASPKCMDEENARDRWGYWGVGRMGPPPPGNGHNGEVRHGRRGKKHD
ncbi:hypothetical protein EK21DRAFT_62175 [Setomelanomma holmii]|uniref:Uncharacterized protein n=1 Tax=Setomelanomma holmii TaxID=210430 RepID=A0A9P4HDY1_9PLEO|nr:hypothetical protein EK21DRAFT_62175 [Setomelanomma holmii]